MKKKPFALSPGALEQLQTYRWPGNVRELQNCIERAVILADGETLLARHLHLSFAEPLTDENAPSPWTHFDLSGTLADVSRRAATEAEKVKIEEVLKEADGNRGRAAELLQVGYKSLLAKLKEHGID